MGVSTVRVLEVATAVAPDYDNRVPPRANAQAFCFGAVAKW